MQTSSVPDLPEVMTFEEAAKELAAIEAEIARRSLIEFIKYTKHDYEVNWHHKLVCEALERVLAGTCRRLMIFMPPQNGKTESVSRRFPAYVFGKKPDTRIIACSYNSAFAQSVSRDVQKVMSTNQYRRVFPKTHLAEVRYEKDPETGRRTHQEKRTQGEFDIVAHRGSYTSAGIDGPIGGKSADIGIIDDPIKNREDAESEVVREHAYNWYISTFSQRQFGSDGAIIICSTRWHQDDLAGRLLRVAKENPAADQWEVISLPAIAEGELHPRDPRREGDPLWPSKYTLEELNKRKALMGAYNWSSLQQQQPTPSGGALFKELWFADKYVDASPALARRVRGWDTASSKKKGSDYTVGCLISECNGRYYVEDLVRGQWSPGEVEAMMKATAQRDGLEISQREEKEGGSAGQTVIDARTITLAGHNYEGVGLTGSKITRSAPFRVQCEAGNVFIVRDQGRGGLDGLGWNRAFIDELTSFPTGVHDDQVDAASCAFNAVLLEPVPVVRNRATW